MSSAPFGLSFDKPFPFISLDWAAVFPGSALVVKLDPNVCAELVEHLLRAPSIAVFPKLRDAPAEFEEANFAAMGCVGTTVLRTPMRPDEKLTLVVTGVARARIVEVTQREPFPTAMLAPVPDQNGDSELAHALVPTIRALTKTLVDLSPEDPLRLAETLATRSTPSALADGIAPGMSVSLEQRAALLETAEVGERLGKLVVVLSWQCEILEMRAAIARDVKAAVDLDVKKNGRPSNDELRAFILRYQRRFIVSDLEARGEKSENTDAFLAALPKSARPFSVDAAHPTAKHIDRELGALKKKQRIEVLFQQLRAIDDELGEELVQKKSPA